MSNLKNILVGKKKNCKSIWFMRQAGRHLPEFRKIRSKNKNFIELCLNVNLSSEITIQPIKKYNLDSAIIFSDILMVPFALGQKVKFTKNKGPALDKFNENIFNKNNKKTFSKKLKPIYMAITKTRRALPKNKSLICFVGAPWTLLVYMLNLKEKKNKIKITKFKKNKKKIYNLLKILTKYICLHIKNQIKAGADVVQVFDSWAGLIPSNDLNTLCINPNLKIVQFCKKNKIPIICFPKGIKKNYSKFNEKVKPDGLSLDYDIDPFWAKKNLKNVVLQGGMHPKVLLKTKDKIYKEAKKYLDIFKDVPYIFNLGHGVLPQTNPVKLRQLIKFVREYK